MLSNFNKQSWVWRGLRPGRRLVTLTLNPRLFLLVYMLTLELVDVPFSFELRDMRTEAGTGVLLELARLDTGLEHLIELLKRPVLGLRNHKEDPQDGYHREAAIDKGDSTVEAALHVRVNKVDGDRRDEAAHGGEEESPLAKLPGADLGGDNPAARAPTEAVDAVPRDEQRGGSIGDCGCVVWRRARRGGNARPQHGACQANGAP